MSVLGHIMSIRGIVTIFLIGIIFCFIGKTASGALLNEKGPRGGGHENGTVVKLEDIKTFCSPIVIIVIEFM